MASIVTQQLLKQIVSKQTLVATSNAASNIEIKIDSLNQQFKDVILEESKNHIVKNDISGRDWKKISELVASSLTKKWIKPIMACDTIIFTEYNRKDCFKLVANVELDTEINTTGKKKDAKKRNTLIRFIPTIELADYKNITEWLYIFTINDRIIKIGGTRTGLYERTASYLTGHHTIDRGKSGSCSNTNSFMYNTLLFYANLGCKIEMYGYKLPITYSSISLFGKKIQFIAQTYHVYESIFIDDYKQTYNEYPFLNDNCDPNYRS